MRSAPLQSIVAVCALAFAGGAAAQEAKIVLKDGPGRDQVTMRCAMCHSLDYVQMNSRFLDSVGWAATVNKMINAFGAPIPQEDVDAIVSYLSQNYGKPGEK
jgi:hypothetical protein